MFVAGKGGWIFGRVVNRAVQQSLVSCLWDRFDECFLRAGTQGPHPVVDWRRSSWQAGQVWLQTGSPCPRIQ